MELYLIIMLLKTFGERKTNFFFLFWVMPKNTLPLKAFTPIINNGRIKTRPMKKLETVTTYYIRMKLLNKYWTGSKRTLRKSKG